MFVFFIKSFGIVSFLQEVDRLAILFGVVLQYLADMDNDTDGLLVLL